MLSALSFLTVLGRGQAPGPRTFRWFPLVGAAVGAVVALSLAGARELWSYPLAAGVAVAVDLAITGMLHVDGLADSADGLLPHLDRERRLEVMRQPDTGSFALGTVVIVVLLRWASLADGTVEPWSLVAVWCVSRTAAAAVPALVPYARSTGLASAFLTGTGRWIGLAILPALGLLGWSQGALGVLAGLVAVATTAALVGWARVRLGGFTGDVLGAGILLSETAALLVLAARP